MKKKPKRKGRTWYFPHKVVPWPVARLKSGEWLIGPPGVYGFLPVYERLKDLRKDHGRNQEYGIMDEAAD
jgi:hypothetical protein